MVPIVEFLQNIEENPTLVIFYRGLCPLSSGLCGKCRGITVFALLAAIDDNHTPRYNEQAVFSRFSHSVCTKIHGSHQNCPAWFRNHRHRRR